MSMFPGGRSTSPGNPPSVADDAIASSMAGLIESEFASMMQSIKGITVPAENREDRRILFVAIARGVLGYIQNTQAGNITAATLPTPVAVTFKIDMNKV